MRLGAFADFLKLQSFFAISFYCDKLRYWVGVQGWGIHIEGF